MATPHFYASSRSHPFQLIWGRPSGRRAGPHSINNTEWPSCHYTSPYLPEPCFLKHDETTGRSIESCPRFWEYVNLSPFYIVEYTCVIGLWWITLYWIYHNPKNIQLLNLNSNIKVNNLRICLTKVCLFEPASYNSDKSFWGTLSQYSFHSDSDRLFSSTVSSVVMANE